jgi:hypothetical protein
MAGSGVLSWQSLGGSKWMTNKDNFFLSYLFGGLMGQQSYEICTYRYVVWFHSIDLKLLPLTEHVFSF